MHPELDEPIYVPIFYELDKAHMDLYRKLAEEQYLELESGGVINAGTGPRLYNAVQQIVMNWHHFSGRPQHQSAGIRLIEMVLEEIDACYRDGKNRLVSRLKRDGKLLVCANYRMTNRYLTEYFKDFGAVAFFSDVSPRNSSRTMTGSSTTRLAEWRFCKRYQGGSVSMISSGCARICCLCEAPVIPMHFTQVVGRIERTGQRGRPLLELVSLKGLSKCRLHDDLLHRDQLVNRIQGGWVDLKDAIYGR